MEYDPLLERIKQLKFQSTSHPLHTPPTLNLGSIHSGTSPNIVPAVCKAQLDIRYLPDDLGDNIINDIKNIIREVEAECPPARFDLKNYFQPATNCRSYQQPVGGVDFKTYFIYIRNQTTAEGDVWRNGNQATYPKGITAVGFGPGDEAEAHATNESISIKELIDFAKIMALITSGHINLTLLFVMKHSYPFVRLNKNKNVFLCVLCDLCGKGIFE